MSDLDRTIDAAARQLIVREPGRGLTHAVMARVRRDEKASSHRFVWVAAAASVLLCAAIAATILNRSPQGLPAVAAAPRLAIAPPLVAVESPTVVAHDVRPSPRDRSAVPSRTIALNATALPRDVSPIAPLVAEPIVVAAIDVPRIEPLPPASIEPINIEQLTIEPLAASND